MNETFFSRIIEERQKHCCNCAVSCVVTHKNPSKRFELPAKLSGQISHQAVNRQTSAINHSHPTHKRYIEHRAISSILCGSRQQCENVHNGHTTTDQLVIL